MPARAWYATHHGRPIYVVEFFDEPLLSPPEADDGQPESWAIFTHGICNAMVGSRMSLHKLAIRADQMGEPSEANLAERLDKAASVLRYMSEQLARHAPDSPAAGQYLRASETLRQERGVLIESIRASVGPATDAAPGPV